MRPVSCLVDCSLGPGLHQSLIIMCVHRQAPLASFSLHHLRYHLRLLIPPPVDHPVVWLLTKSLARGPPSPLWLFDFLLYHLPLPCLMLASIRCGSYLWSSFPHHRLVATFHPPHLSSLSVWSSHIFPMPISGFHGSLRMC